MTMTNYTNKSQQLLMQVIDILSDAPLRSASLADLVERTGAGRDQAFRAAKNLEIYGWAEMTVEGWRLTPRLTQLSERVRLDIALIHHTYLTPTEANT